MDRKALDPDEFKVSRHAACKFLGVSDSVLISLELPYYRVSPRSNIRYRQSDLDSVKENSIHNAEAVQA